MANDETYSGSAYCVRCREKRAIESAPVTLSVSEKTGRETRIAKAKCPVCDTTITRILGKVTTA